MIAAVCQDVEQVHLAIAGTHLAFEVEQHQAIIAHRFSLDLILRLHDESEGVRRIFVNFMVALHSDHRA